MITEDEEGRERERERERELVVSIITHSMDWSSHIYMNPHSFEVKAKMGSDKESGTRTLSIATIL